MPSKPLNPSIRLDPFIINNIHKQTKNNANISIFMRWPKYSTEILSIAKSLNNMRGINKKSLWKAWI